MRLHDLVHEVQPQPGALAGGLRGEEAVQGLRRGGVGHPDARVLDLEDDPAGRAVLGGAGSVLGAILGAAILTLLPQALTVFAEYEQVMLGLIMMLVMIFMRDGLLPSVLRVVRGRGE